MTHVRVIGGGLAGCEAAYQLAQAGFDPPVGPPGDQRLLSPHNRPVRTADGWISFTVNTDAQVRAFLTAVDRAVATVVLTVALNAGFMTLWGVVGIALATAPAFLATALILYAAVDRTLAARS